MNENVSTLLVIESKIKEVADMADLLPLVIIIHELPDLKLRYMSALGLRLLGTNWDAIEKMKYEEFMKKYFNEDDFREATEKIIRFLKDNTGEFVSYFQQVKTSKTREWDWYMNTVKVLLRDHDQNPVLLITTAMQIDPEHYFISKASRLLEENVFMKNHYSNFASLGEREKEVLKLMVLGKTSAEIGDQLFISTATAETHRKNIRRKLETANTYELSIYARAFGLV